MPAILREEDYARIEKFAGVAGTEDIAVVTTRSRGKLIRSIHVFARQPMTKEITEYENTASKVKFKGNSAQVEGSQLTAAKHLYNHLIARAYHVPVGREVFGRVDVDEKTGEVVSGKPLSRDEAIEKVPVLIKREAVRDMIAQHWSAGQLVEMQGDDDGEEEKKPADAEDD